VNYLARRRAARRRQIAEWANRARRLAGGEPVAAAQEDRGATAVSTEAEGRRLPFELLDPASAAQTLGAIPSPSGNGDGVSAANPTAELTEGPPDVAAEPPIAHHLATDASAEQQPAPLATDAPRQPSTDEQLYQGARQAWERRDLHRASAMYYELLARDERHVRGRNNLALVLDELGEHEQALEELERCRTIDPASLEVRVNRSAVLGALGRYAEAERELLDVLAQAPTSGEAYFNLGLVAARRGRWDHAAVHLARAIELNAGRDAAHYYLGEALNHVDDLPGALQAYQRAIELAPNNPKAHYGLGIVLDRMNRPDEAAQAYRRSRELRIR
jgi:tetratricopeptide (TPR) repeat protein